MSAPGRADQSAKRAYEVYASVYDAFNRAYMYERWTGRLLAKAEEKGLEGDRLLDVAEGDPGSVHVHRQRHFTTEEVLKAAEGAGLRLLGVAGELDGALEDEPSEDHHTKAVYLFGTS